MRVNRSTGWKALLPIAVLLISAGSSSGVQLNENDLLVGVEFRGECFHMLRYLDSKELRCRILAGIGPGADAEFLDHLSMRELRNGRVCWRFDGPADLLIDSGEEPKRSSASEHLRVSLVGLLPAAKEPLPAGVIQYLLKEIGRALFSLPGS